MQPQTFLTQALHLAAQRSPDVQKFQLRETFWAGKERRIA